MDYGSKPLPTRPGDRQVAAIAGYAKPDGVTEAVSNFYHWFLVLVFVIVSALAALVLATALYQFYVAEYREQKDVWLLSLVYIVVAYLVFVLSVGLMATVLSMRRHLVYHSRLLEIIARNGTHQQPTDENRLM